MMGTPAISTASREMAEMDIGSATNGYDLGRLITEAVGDGFSDETRARYRDPNALGISSLPGCTRAAAFAMSGERPSDVFDTAEARMANIGTWIHQGLLPRLASRLDGVIEREVTLSASGVSIPGHIDVDTPTVTIDLKTVMEWGLQDVRSDGPRKGHWLQVAGYGVARLQAGDPPKYLSIVYLDRSVGDEEVFVTPFVNRHLVDVLERVAEIARWAEDAAVAPRRDAFDVAMYGPGHSSQCDTCPWLRGCWGDDVRTDRARHQFDDSEVERLLLEYVELTAAGGRSDRRRHAIVALLEATRYGTYGRASYRRGRGSEVDDQAAACALLRDMGYEVPRRTRRGQLRIRLLAKRR